MVTQRGKVWYARIEMKDAAGNRKQKWISLPGATGKRAAEREVERIRTEMRAGTYHEPAKQKLGEFLLEWLVGLRTRGLTERTIIEYEHKVQRHLIPRIGGVALGDLKQRRIRALYATLLESGRLDGKGGLDPSTVERVHSILKQALDQAVEEGVLDKNPAGGKKMAPRQQHKEVVCPDEDQIARLLEAALAVPKRSTRLYLPLLLLATTALRRNEALGLRWRDIDLERGLLTVSQTLVDGKGGVRIKPSPKNDSSRRTIRLPAITIVELRSHREEQFTRRQALGNSYHDQGLVFERGDGTPLRPTSFSNAVTSLARKVGLEGIHVHSLRHGHISQLIAQNAPMKAIQARAGHSKIQTTMNTYGHLLPGVEEEMIEKFDVSFRAAAKRGRVAAGV